MIKSSLLNYELPNSSINQEPYENPLDSKLLISKNRENYEKVLDDAANQIEEFLDNIDNQKSVQ